MTVSDEEAAVLLPPPTAPGGGSVEVECVLHAVQTLSFDASLGAHVLQKTSPQASQL